MTITPDITLRRATVAFVDLLGAGPLADAVGIERAYAIVTGGLRMLEGIARRRGAVIDKYLSDCLMAVFGFPLVTAEPEAAAVAAALEMQEAMARYERQVESPTRLELRIGINTGTMVAGDLQGPIVREFRVLGDPVNVAARLKDLGVPGAIHIGPETHAASQTRFRFETLEPLVLRGKRKLVPAFRVLGPAETGDSAAIFSRGPATTSALLGRDAELALLRERVAALRAGRGGGILVIGDEGLGKSELVAAVRAEAATAGVAAGLVVREDVHTADPAATDALVQSLTDAREQPTLFVLTCRREIGAAVLDRLRAALGETRCEITLAPLDDATSRRLVQQVAGEGTLSAAALDRIAARAGGVPSRLVLGALLAPAVENEMALEHATVERSTEAERRQVTVLFADITGFTRLSEQLEPAAAYSAVTGCLQVMHDASLKHGAGIDKHLGDCIMAVFGVPVAVENAPRAAVNAAIEMRRRVREWNEAERPPVTLDVHIGINTGLSIAGDVSGALLREFALMGDAVNTASKLKDLAPAGHIWVGRDTARATDTDFTYVPAIRPEGTPAANAFELTSEREQIYRPRIGTGETIFAEHIGREAELAALQAAVARLAAGAGGVATVVGEPGLGKSRLFAELVASGEVRRVRWAEGRSVPAGRTQRYHPFVDLVRSMLDLGDGDTPDAFAQFGTASAAALGTDADDTLPFLANLLGMPLPEALAERVAGVPGDVLDRLTLHAVRTLLVGLARERPLALFFEDVHWADRSSIELLGLLLRLAVDHPILFLWASRPGFESTGRLAEIALASLRPEQRLELALHPLGPADTRRLLATLFPPGGLPRGVRERIEGPAGGNPLYIEELLRALIEQGAIEVTGTGLRATAAIESIVVPATVQEVILVRVDRLTPIRKRVLHLAAVIGQRVAEPVLAELLDDPPACAAVLAHLIEAQLLVREQRGEQAHYTFKHRLIQEVAYGSILETRRAELHGQVGRVIEARLPGSPGYHGMLAYHYGRAGDVDRAEEHLFLAGDDAARAGAPAEALELFQESSRLYFARHPDGGDPVKRARLHKGLAGAYFFRGQLEDANQHFNQALESLGERVPHTRVALTLGLVRTLTTVVLDAYLRGGGGTRRPPADARDIEVIQLMFDRARAQTTADPTRFLFDSMETLRRLRRVDPASVPGAGGMYAGAGTGIWSYAGLSFDLGARFLTIANRYVDPDDVPERLLYGLMNFVHCFFAGDWRPRHRLPDSLLDDGLRAGQLWDVVTYAGLETYQTMAQGEFQATEAQIDRLARIEEGYAYDLARSNRHSAIAFLHAERRALDDALAAADTYLVEHAERQLNLFALGIKAKVQVLGDDLSGARATLDAAADLLRQGRVPPIHFGFCARARLLLDVALLERDGSEARETATTLRRDIRDAKWAAARTAWLGPEIARATGRALWLTGKRRGGVQSLSRAIDEAERLGMGPEAARARVELARCVGGDEARALRRDARETFERLGLAWDAERVDRTP